MNLTIDRFEKDTIVVESENNTFFNLPRKLFPDDAKEGDVFALTKNTLETTNRKQRISRLMDDLFEK